MFPFLFIQYQFNNVKRLFINQSKPTHGNNKDQTIYTKKGQSAINPYSNELNMLIFYTGCLIFPFKSFHIIW